MALDRSTRWFDKNTCSARAEFLNPNSSEPCGVPKDGGPKIYPFDQCRCWHIQHMRYYTPIPSCGLLVLGPWSTQGTKDDLDGWRVRPTDGFGQSADVGESHRSTDLTVTWNLPIRLWADVLVYEPLGIPISLESLRHKLSCAHEERASALHISVFTTAHLWDAGWCEWKHRYWSVWVTLWYTVGWSCALIVHPH